MTSSLPILSDLCEFIADCEHKTAPTQEEGYPSIRTPNIGRGRLILEGVNRVSEETFSAWTRRAEPKAGDLILAREAPVGNVAIVPPNLKVCLGQRTVLIRPDATKVESEYLLYLLLGDEIQARFHSQSNGATVGHLNLSDIRKLALPHLPPRSNQRKIAAILSAYDSLIENNTRRIQILEEMARALYREWFVEFRAPKRDKVPNVPSTLSLIPHEWGVGKLGDIAYESRVGVHPSAVAADTPYIGLEHLPRRSIALGEWGKASDVASAKLRFEQNDILFGKIRPYFHKVAVAPVSGVCSTDAIVIKPKDDLYFAFALCCVSSDSFVLHAVQTSNGTKMPRANWDVMCDYAIPIPPTYILEQFAATVKPIITSVQNLVLRNRNLRRTRDLLLPKLVSGEVSKVEIGR